ncbi:MAG: diadenylate cyclase CdaA [Clostridia bacterium]
MDKTIYNGEVNGVDHVWGQLWNILSQFTWRDAIDLIIITYVIYKLLMLTRETRAAQVLKGLGIILVASSFSEWLRFPTINWILRQTINAGAIALVIVFQPELRRALEQIGRGKIFEKSLFIQQEEKDISWVIQELIRATQNLSKKKIGALIVIEQKTGISEVVESGVRIDGVVSSALLENIFEPNTPLHDGAVIIREDRIVAASCFLTLTENPNLSKQLGTRHRAALGISENSDAVVIIISEETGIISMAQGGKLTRYLDSKGLRDILKKIYEKDKETKPLNLIKWRTRND